jgi:hypothetical protein
MDDDFWGAFVTVVLEGIEVQCSEMYETDEIDVEYSKFFDMVANTMFRELKEKLKVEEAQKLHSELVKLETRAVLYAQTGVDIEG